MIDANTQALVSYLNTMAPQGPTFQITFPVFVATDVIVEVTNPAGVVTTLDLTTDFTLSNVGIKPYDAGNVILVNLVKPYLTAGQLATNHRLVIRFNPNAYQNAQLFGVSKISPESIERALDRLTMSILAVKAISATTTGVAPYFASLIGKAGKIVIVNLAEDGFEYSGVPADLTAAQAAAAASATAAAASATNSATSATAANTSKNNAATSATASEVARAASVVAKTASETAATGSAASQTAAAGSATAAGVSAGQAAASATAASGAGASATAAAASATAANTSKLAAAASATNAAASDNSANLSELNAAMSEIAASGSATAAASSATNAATQKSLAEGFKNDSLFWSNESMFWSDRALYETIVNLDITDSPFTVNALDDNTLYIVDTTGGDVTISLPLISSIPPIAWKIGIIKESVDGNEIIIDPAGANTVNNLASTSVFDPQVGALVYANSPSDWKVKFFTNAIIAADALPPGGLAGDILVKNSSAAGDATWQVDKSIINALIFG